MRAFVFILGLIALTACSVNDPATTWPDANPPGPPPSSVNLTYFGYSAIACSLDDPHDDSAITDYSLEVANFTNANQVCVTVDLEELTRRLQESAGLYRPLLYVEPVFFEFNGRSPGLKKDRNALWNMVMGAIEESGIDPTQLVFYLVDEPQLRGLSHEAITIAAAEIRHTYPDAVIMVIEAYLPERPVFIPEGVNWWGFNAYTIKDPGADPAYIAHLTRASAACREGQSLIIVMDAQHTPIHSRAGLSEADMADVARNYLRLANGRDDVIALLGYTWAGGIDGDYEKGVRDMPESVQAAHRAIGQQIVR